MGRYLEIVEAVREVLKRFARNPYKLNRRADDAGQLWHAVRDAVYQEVEPAEDESDEKLAADLRAMVTLGTASRAILDRAAARIAQSTPPPREPTCVRSEGHTGNCMARDGTSFLDGTHAAPDSAAPRQSDAQRMDWIAYHATRAADVTEGTMHAYLRVDIPEGRTFREAIDVYMADAAPDSAAPRPCTCHPDDNPPRPCPQKFALTECRAAAAEAAQVEQFSREHWEQDFAAAQADAPEGEHQCGWCGYYAERNKECPFRAAAPDGER
jgi:hypothetical protein